MQIHPSVFQQPELVIHCSVPVLELNRSLLYFIKYLVCILLIF